MNIEDAKTRLQELGPVIAKVLDPDFIARELTMTPIKESGLSASFSVYLAGKRGFVKIFAANETATAAFGRERTALEGFHQNDVPKLLLVSEKDRLIMTSFIAGTLLNDTITSENVLHMAGRMGQWFGHLANLSPHKDTEGTWDSYLENYDKGLNIDVLNKNAAIFKTVDISRLTLAHNDNALSNFIIGMNKRLYGIDFEDAQFKPEGWDLVTAAQSLIRKFPQDLPSISTSLLRGYQSTVKTSSLPEYFDQIINLLAVARAVATASSAK